jgi:hypothetical protein
MKQIERPAKENENNWNTDKVNVALEQAIKAQGV